MIDQYNSRLSTGQSDSKRLSTGQSDSKSCPNLT